MPTTTALAESNPSIELGLTSLQATLVRRLGDHQATPDDWTAIQPGEARTLGQLRRKRLAQTEGQSRTATRARLTLAGCEAAEALRAWDERVAEVLRRLELDQAADRLEPAPPAPDPGHQDQDQAAAELVPCPRCGGQGDTPGRLVVPGRDFGDDDPIPCPACGGSGKVPADAPPLDPDRAEEPAPALEAPPGPAMLRGKQAGALLRLVVAARNAGPSGASSWCYGDIAVAGYCGPSVLQSLHRAGLVQLQRTAHGWRTKLTPAGLRAWHPLRVAEQAEEQRQAAEDAAHRERFPTAADPFARAMAARIAAYRHTLDALEAQGADRGIAARAAAKAGQVAADAAWSAAWGEFLERLP